MNEYSADSFPRLRLGDYELPLDPGQPHELRYLQSYRSDPDYLIAEAFIRKGDSVLDLGANIGFTALCYIERGAALVYAFEPMEELAQRIEKIGCPKIALDRHAVSDAGGAVDMYPSTGHNQGHSLNAQWPELFPAVFEGSRARQVERVTLDGALPIELFDFIKIDIEGVEDQALRGGRSFFRRNAGATLQIEIYDPMLPAVLPLIREVYERMARVAVSRAGELVLVDAQIAEAERANRHDLHWGPPNYLCWNGAGLPRGSARHSGALWIGATE